LARLFDNQLLSILVDSAIEPGALLWWYISGTATPAVTYTTEDLDPLSENTNPVVADGQGRFPAIWLDTGVYKYILTEAGGNPASPIKTVPVWNADAEPPTVDPTLSDFLAGTDPLPIANGGTGDNNAPDALANLGALPLAGGTVTGSILRGAAPYIFFATSGALPGSLILTPTGDPDPTSVAWQLWAKY
jgi:hypothetical protein